MRKRMLLGAALLALAMAAGAAEDKAGYIKLLNDGKMEELQSYLESWKSKAPEDPELCIGFFNYYLNMARSERIVFGGQKPPRKGDYFEIADSDTGKKVGYMYGEVDYDPEYAGKALAVINEGLQRAPDRLDMRFGKTRLLAELRAYEAEKDYLIRTLERHDANRGAWYWSDGLPFEDGRAGFIDALHDYIREWFELQSPAALGYARDLSARLIASCPDSVVAYNDNALAHAQLGDLPSAERSFLKAYELDGSDYVVIGNLAYLNEVKGDKAAAIRFYELLLAAPNRQLVDRANRRLAELRK